MRAGRTAARDDPRGHGGDQGVVEVAEQRLEPALCRHAVGVDERDEWAVHRGQPGVARARPDRRWRTARRRRHRVARRSPWWRPHRPTRRRPRCRPARRARRSSRSSWAGRSRTGHHDGDVAGPDAAVGGLRGEGAARRPAGAPAVAAERRGPTGSAIPPALRPAGGARSEIRKRRSGLPPRSTVPPSNSRVDAVLGQGEGAGQRRGGPGGRRSERRGPRVR